ncbi:MAG: fumarylacetoacetate hydrolase family protein [Alphaproteobacteria bacterium]|nr:fumarylacetoacetate hydrolase family protein [Alphaproteobacteria bacterium]
MKLLRYGEPGAEKPALLDGEGRIRDLYPTIGDLAGHVLTPEGLDQLRALDVETLPLVDGAPRIGPCVGQVGTFFCIGLNYQDHAAESGSVVPDEPLVFSKAISAICGASDDLIIPRGSEKTDWEVELGVVIGKTARYVSESEALDHVAGYCTINDVSERDFQKERGGQWIKGKSAESFGPIGPWLVTADEVPDPQALSLWLEVDGNRYQDGTTADMIFPVRTIVSYLSQFMVLRPGDVIATGTPPGVGMGMTPEVYLRPGQTVRLGVEGLGVQEHSVIRAV